MNTTKIIMPFLIMAAATAALAADNESHFDLAFPDWPQGHPWYGRPMPIQTMTPINAERTRLTGEDPSRLLFGLTEGPPMSKNATVDKQR